MIRSYCSDGQQPCSDGQQPCSDGQHPCSDGQHPCSDGQQHGQHPCSIGQHPCSDGQQPESRYRQSWFTIPVGCMTEGKLNERAKFLFKVLCRKNTDPHTLQLRVMLITCFAAMWVNCIAQRGQDGHHVDIAKVSRACVWILDVIASDRYAIHDKPRWHLCDFLVIPDISVYRPAVIDPPISNDEYWNAKRDPDYLGFELIRGRLMLTVLDRPRPDEAGCYYKSVTQFKQILDGWYGGCINPRTDSIIKRFARRVTTDQHRIRCASRFLHDRLGYGCAELVIAIVEEHVYGRADLPTYMGGQGREVRQLIYGRPK